MVKAALAFSVLLATVSCTTVPLPRTVGLVRKVMEHPMSGKRASEPIADSLHRITTRTSPDHLGTDFTSRKLPLPVFAVKEGTVVSNTTALSNSGAATITVLNTDGSVSRYLHVGSPVQPGDGLTIGEPLGKVLLPGQPGYGATNTGPHVHYEQYLDQRRFDARQYMTTEEVISQWLDGDS
jgi:murein DD-endopeptidase MepM/ murein hydrolase activator NlpD